MTTFIGIDLAWRSERNHTGATVLRGDRGGAELVGVLDSIRAIADVRGFVEKHAGASTFIAIDAPLIIENVIGLRPCETAVGREYGSLEVYPHAGLVALFDLPKSLKYKKGTLEQKRIGLRTLAEHLRRLTHAMPLLRGSVCLDDLLSRDPDSLLGTELKAHEDRLDALFCAYLAYYFWYWRLDRNQVFGDLETGYIVNPTLRPGGIAGHAA